jgi:hypothetical protein
MPYKITPSKSPSKGKFKVTSPSGVRAKGTTAMKARRQVNLLNAIDRGWKPTKAGQTKRGGK